MQNDLRLRLLKATTLSDALRIINRHTLHDMDDEVLAHLTYLSDQLRQQMHTDDDWYYDDMPSDLLHELMKLK